MLPEKFRLQRLIFLAARKAYDQMKDTFSGGREYLVYQLIRLVEEFINSDRLVIPSLFHQEPLRKRIEIVDKHLKAVSPLWEKEMARARQHIGALDQALAVVDNDPALLQERAELAVLQQDFALAAQLAERAYALGAQVGPLCRRHWATLEQLRLRTGDADGVASARAQIEGCRVSGPERY